MQKASSIDVLRAFLDRPDTVIFVGSGLSAWSGLPSWTALIQQLIGVARTKGARTSLAERFLAEGQLLDAADALQLTATEIAQALRTNVGSEKAKPHKIHSYLTNLGPQRFVTTNYDSLIEQQLGLEGRLGEFRIIAGTQTADFADLIKASSDRFVFKPHGDISNAESIVLSTRDYERVILGHRNLVRNALETLLVTRPVLFLGFGLRDPDTGLVLRALRDRYLGSVADFLAIVPDVGEEEASYWWDRYRIRLITYATSRSEAGQVDHSGLLSILDQVSSVGGRPDTIRLATSGQTDSRDFSPHRLAGATARERVRHALTRYAARFVRAGPPVQFPVRVFLEDVFDVDVRERPVARLHNSRVEDLLEQASQSVILQGAAGSGKTFAISRYLSRLGRRILDWCDETTEVSQPPSIPILLDARLYSGSFAHLLAAATPKELDLSQLSRVHQIVVIVDSVDEMPHDELDAGRWQSDLQDLLADLEDYRIVYGTRRADLIGQPDIPVFSVWPLDENVVERALVEVGVQPDSVSNGFLVALSTPFLLGLARLLLPMSPDIRSAPKLIEKFLSERTLEWFSGDAASMRSTLSELAWALIYRGRDTMRSDEAQRIVADQMLSAQGPQKKQDIIDALVSAGVLCSEIDENVRFVHRSVTEYLAAGKLAQAWRDRRLDLGEMTATLRWDNAIAWSVASMDDKDAEELLEQTYALSIDLAHRIVVAAESNRARMWRIFLRRLVQKPISDEELFRFTDFEPDGAIPQAVGPELQALVQLPGGAVAGWAMRIFAPFADDSEIESWIDKARVGRIEYNASNFAGPALAECLARSDMLFGHFLNALSRVEWEGKADSDNDHRRVALEHGFGAIIESLPTERLLEVLEWVSRAWRPN
ncbi:MAG: SIR2 family protein [Kiloniellaceae bacterium]